MTDEQLSGPLGTGLSEHLTAAELAALRRRIHALIDHPVLPAPGGRNPLPWPAF